MVSISKQKLFDKIIGGWAGQTIGVPFGGPTEFRYNGTMIPDHQKFAWYEGYLKETYLGYPGLYDDIYMDLTFVEVMEKLGLDAPAEAHAKAFANADYDLWHANGVARYNILHGISPPESCHWKHNPQADAIDFQIEADFAGLMNPAMPQTAMKMCDKVGHIMNYGDGFYGGVYVATMYSLAFTNSNIEYIVNEVLKSIPKESNYHKCISDVIRWHKKNPKDWKSTWFEVEKKYDKDLIVPQGVFVPFNIDATINSAYVVIGLLYGEGNYTKTMEISTRCGQDSHCNPSTAGGILGTVLGYDKIPAYWKKGLDEVEDMDFKNTNLSLNDVYKLGMKHTLLNVTRNGGNVEGEVVNIKKQNILSAPFEVSHPNIFPKEKQKFVNVLNDTKLEVSTTFEGTGFAIIGNIENPKGDTTLKNSSMIVELFIDDKLIESPELPVLKIRRRFDLFYGYNLPKGKHTLKIKVMKDNGLKLQTSALVVYTDTPYSYLNDSERK